jgi:general secretion pathway protein A
VQAAAVELQWVEYAERVRDLDTDTDQTGRQRIASSAYGKLELLHRDQFLTDYDLHPGRIIIGRTSDNDLQIRSKFISRHHAQIISDVQQSLLEDLNSTNGVFVRSQRIKRHRLSEGDVIQLGEHRLVYRELRGQAGPSSMDDEMEEDDRSESDGDLEAAGADDIDEDERHEHAALPEERGADENG